MNVTVPASAAPNPSVVSSPFQKIFPGEFILIDTIMELPIFASVNSPRRLKAHGSWSSLGKTENAKQRKETNMAENIPAAAAPAPKPKRAPRSEQDQRISNDITGTDELLTLASGDAEIAPLMAGKGYTATKFTEGTALQKAASDAFDARQAA